MTELTAARAARVSQPMEPAHVVGVASPAMRLCARTGSSAEASALAEALYEARPNWRITIDGRRVVFSREGKVADIV